ncbi:ABC transporter ATP-binding protein [Paracoccus suum]|uniref:ABC transporter ATP-binding protein n=1 Tax=Paracoccus suum TaxID=2259340 RepID=A0A344PMH8_9RHOB|nr:ABC transporter ATP-binding protein [Paracoccus suum]AXC50583.1 ABC transporter ATP-binding protein [Paracoccus suum]
MSGNDAVRFDGVVKRHGALAALKGVNFSIQPGEFFALLGPSGSGKSTTLRLMAGLDQPSEGRILFDGADVTAREAQDRDVAMVFQSYALYPHMTVGQNIAFPLEMAKVPKAQIVPQVAEAARKVSIGHLLDRKPGQLSGGQQQRCALARAIVRKANLFLLDEPLSNLDAKLRLETRAELKKLQRDLAVTTVYVTHDQEEALTLADRMAVFMDGEIVQIGTPAEVFARPNSLQVAGFIGSPPMNLMRAAVRGGAVTLAGQPMPVKLPARADGEVILGVRPSAVRLGREGVPVTVELVENLGDSAIAELAFADGTARARLSDAAVVTEGQHLSMSFAAKDIHLFDPATGARVEPE